MHAVGTVSLGLNARRGNRIAGFEQMCHCQLNARRVTGFEQVCHCQLSARRGNRVAGF